MISRRNLEDVMPKTNKQSGILALGVLAVLLAVPTLLYLWIVKRESNNNKANY